MAVDLLGWRLGKGGGYGDIEVKKIKDQFGEILILTTIHPLQIVEFVPHLDHDAKVDIMVTPEKIYRIENREQVRPFGSSAFICLTIFYLHFWAVYYICNGYEEENFKTKGYA